MPTPTKPALHHGAEPKHHFAPWLLAVAVVAAGVLMYAGARQLNAQAVEPAASPTARHYLLSNEVGATGAYVARISQVTETSAPDPAFAIDTAHTFLILNVAITNHLSGPVDFMPVNHLYVRDNEGGTFPMHPASSLTSPIAAGKLQPGQTVSGQVSFVIPKKLARPLLYVDPQWDDLAPIVFDVLH